ncbi:serine kinase [Hoeflea sp. BAL378]|uniref:3-oxo-tetronate kinase n=1 Tax=Hoeflea sp. BAL378 TaxID=1547437 RepID=UPI0005134A20|nr:3-oxo-tetronate kinase [Hoeflea sp. BAL378]KGF69064.1 serine kinase [Hoeflea sp. BAL378]
MSLVFAAVADDLTGGLEMAAMLVAAGIDCALVTEAEAVDDLDDVEAVVVAQKTRVTPADEAVAKMEAAADRLLKRGARTIFFKYCATFDSTDKGNIGPVSDALMQLTGAPYTAFCPASPDLGRTVYNGHLFVGRDLVSNSPKRFDPLTPMTDPDLIAVLQRQTRHKVGLLERAAIARGGDALRAAVDGLERQGLRYFIADTIENADLHALAELTVDWKLMTGNATIVRFYPEVWRERGYISTEPRHRPLPAVGGYGVVLSGSCAERTLEQLKHFERSHPVLWLDLTAPVSAEALIDQAFTWVQPLLQSGSAAIATSAAPETVKAAQARHGREGAAALAEQVMGTLAARLRDIGVRRFVVAGGETSGSVIESLKVRRLTVGPYGGPGVGHATFGTDDPIAVCLKSGKLGPVDLFETSLASMQLGSGSQDE